MPRALWNKRPAKSLGFELIIVYLGFTAGLLFALGLAIPEDIKATLPHWVTVLWGSCLVLGCGLVLYAIFRSKLLIERAGLIIIGPTAIVYAMTAFTYAGWSALFAAIPYILFSYACFDRFSDINKALNSVVDYGK